MNQNLTRFVNRNSEPGLKVTLSWTPYFPLLPNFFSWEQKGCSWDVVDDDLQAKTDCMGGRAEENSFVSSMMSCVQGVAWPRIRHALQYYQLFCGHLFTWGCTLKDCCLAQQNLRLNQSWSAPCSFLFEKHTFNYIGENMSNICFELPNKDFWQGSSKTFLFPKEVIWKKGKIWSSTESYFWSWHRVSVYKTRLILESDKSLCISRRLKKVKKTF